MICTWSLTAREITYNNFEISLVVFMPNITTNHAITYTYHARGQHLCKLIATNEIAYVRKEFNFHRTSTWPRFTVLGLRHGGRDVL